MKKITSAGLALALLLSWAPAALGAEDPAEAYMEGLKIFSTFSDGEFHGERMLSRSEFAVAAVQYLEPTEIHDGCFWEIAPSYPPKYTLLFSDVRKDIAEATHLCAGMVTGIINGNEDGSFRPQKIITIAEASKMLAQGYGLTYPSLTPSGKPWYYASMRALMVRGGLESDASPHAPLRRKDAARMLYSLRFQERFPAMREVGKKAATHLVAQVNATPETAADTGDTVVPSTLYIETPQARPARKPRTVKKSSSSSMSVEETVRTRRTDVRVSRRTLLKQEYAKAKVTGK
jgi:hypothetical protein